MLDNERMCSSTTSVAYSETENTFCPHTSDESLTEASQPLSTLNGIYASIKCTILPFGLRTLSAWIEPKSSLIPEQRSVN